MNIPHSFKKRIGEVFYDKTNVYVLTVVESVNSIGEVTKTFNVEYPLICNIQPANSRIMTKEFGQVLEATHRVSTENNNVTKSNVISVDDRKFEIIALQHFDSHTIVMIKELSDGNL